MPGRPTRLFLAAEVLVLLAAIPAGFAATELAGADWDLPLLAVLLTLAVVSDLTAIDAPARWTKISSSFLSIVLATAFAGPAPAALLGVATILLGWLRARYSRQHLLINVVIYAWFPLIAGAGFHEAIAASGDDSGTTFYALLLGLFAVSLLINFSLVVGYSFYEDGSRFLTTMKRVVVPILPSELVSALAAVGVAWVYRNAGVPALALVGAVVIGFQYLVGALLLSQQRADELELRARQLAGFQIALLTSLLRTLDLRDRRTARHSAAVARYSGDIAVALDLPTDEQERAHTAGLLHDIGKFSFPDRLLKMGVELTEEDWDMIRMHPYEGARVISQVDGYNPVGEIVLAHHERIDGLGYPRGLSGEQIPRLARIVAVAEAYDTLTSRDSYRQSISWFEAIERLREVAGSQLDADVIEALAGILEHRGSAYRHGEDADFDTELALERRIRDHVDRSPKRVESGLELGLA